MERSWLVLRGCLRKAFCSSELRRCSSLTGSYFQSCCRRESPQLGCRIEVRGALPSVARADFFFGPVHRNWTQLEKTREKTPPPPPRPGVSAQRGFFFFASLRTKTPTGKHVCCTRPRAETGATAALDASARTADRLNGVGGGPASQPSTSAYGHRRTPTQLACGQESLRTLGRGVRRARAARRHQCRRDSAVAIDGDRGSGAALRRRERRSRAWQRHVRTAVQLALAEKFPPQHEQGGAAQRPHGDRRRELAARCQGSRRTLTSGPRHPCLRGCGQHLCLRRRGHRGATVRGTSLGAPSLALPVLVANDTLDNKAVSFLLSRALQKRKEEEVERRSGEVEQRRRSRYAGQVFLLPDAAEQGFASSCPRLRRPSWPIVATSFRVVPWPLRHG